MRKTVWSSVMILFATISAGAQRDYSRFEFGGHFTALGPFDATTSAPADLVLARDEFTNPINAGLGGRFTLNFTSWLALEAEGNVLPRGAEYTGRSRQLFYGMKVGLRKRDFGLFAKARPGYMFFTKSLCDGFGFFNGFYTCLGSYRTNPAFDAGIVVEYYRSKRTFVRLDLGDSIVHFGNINRYQPELGQANHAIKVAGGTTHSTQVSVGLGVRF
ncbi:MAG TPA: hypothetical protein VFV34_09905 [Blastocatellia bacterium]|nr:hypothetical protein [Blastocatellia bacterium]